MLLVWEKTSAIVIVPNTILISPFTIGELFFFKFCYLLIVVCCLSSVVDCLPCQIQQSWNFTTGKII